MRLAFIRRSRNHGIGIAIDILVQLTIITLYRCAKDTCDLQHLLYRFSIRVPGNNVSLILMGSYLVEKIFNIDGMGLLGLESVVERDYPVVMGILVISSLLFMIGNILSDVCVAIVDPRVKFE